MIRRTGVTLFCLVKAPFLSVLVTIGLYLDEETIWKAFKRKDAFYEKIGSGIFDPDNEFVPIWL